MKTEKIEFEIDGVKHTVELRELNFGEYNQLEEEATDIKITGITPIVKISTAKLKELSILKSVVSSTVPLKTVEDIRKLPREIGNMLTEKVTSLNSLEDKKKD